ncbi:MAG: Glucose-1-phosphate cytidylyltransferase [Parcubacteria group bacterium Licking1014_1]|nr:MAG: Glucose-1-phosphate cytidylyltransferase [Parcubacteria group bacterium Licking1014_1]
MQTDNIKTIILCGGTGTRLKEETEFKPKPMVEIGGKPILWHIMKIYNHFGYKDFVLALGYKGTIIKDHFLRQKHYTSDIALNTKDGKVIAFDNDTPDNPTDDFNIIFSDTGLDTLHGERVLKLKKYITEDLFMVTYGDGVADIDINKLVEFHKNHGKIATITGVHPISRWGLVNTADDHTVTEFAQKPLLYDYVNGGFMVFNKEFFNYLKPGDMIEDALFRLIPQKQVMLYKHEGFWYGMDTYKDYLFLNDLWEKNPKWKIWANPNSKSKNILVTGGAGFIGSNLVNELIQKGHSVVVIDNLSSGRKENINPKAKFYEADVRDKKISEIFEKENPKIVFHLAAQPLVEDAYKNPFEAIETNVMGTVNILEICRQRKNIESIIVTSSDKAYGKSKELPYKEHFPLKGDHPYDASKSSADLIAQTYFSTYGMPVVITRFSNVFGPGDLNFSRIVPGIMESVIKNKELLIRSDGKSIREYTYVKDIVDGCIELASHKKNGGEAFNFGSENIFSVIDIIKKAEEILETKINYKIMNTEQNEIPEQYLDWTKAKEILNWKPKTSFEQGIKETYNWLKSKKIVL